MTIKISALPVAATVLNTDLIPIVHGGATQSCTPTQIVAAAGGGGGSVPTGTGVRKVVANVEQPTASLIVNADIDPAAAIALSKLAPGASAQVPLVNSGGTAFVPVTVSGDVTINPSGVTAIGTGAITDAKVQSGAGIAGTKIAPDFGAQNVVTTGYASIGATPASVGSLRLPNTGSAFIRNAAASGDVCVFDTDASNQVFLGGNQTYASQALFVRIFPSSGGYLGYGGAVVVLKWSSTAIEVAKPQIGSSTAWGAVNGTGTQAMADAPQTMAAAVYQCAAWLFTGAETADRTVTIPAATDAQSYQRPVQSNCTGAHNVILSTGSGATVSLGDGAANKQRIIVDSRGVTAI